MAMSGSWSPTDLPNLNDNNYIQTSPAWRGYNCIAWAAGDTTRWWWPLPQGMTYWPKGILREVTLESFIQAFGTLGYLPCPDDSLEPEIEKIALFAKREGFQLVPTHAARQLESGEWTSKIGTFEDINHTTLNAVSGPIYGKVVRFLSRCRPCSRIMQ